ncbi:MAG: ATP-binding protein [Alphaproteobacteria bacterium]|jgi:signal transduction histidine kinase|nr:ATP-binding protein [Alphaproteobacteria bacterium]
MSFLGAGSLARRLLIGAVVWCLVVLAGGAFALSALYRAQTVSLLEEDLDATLVTLSRAVEYSPEGRLVTDKAKLPADRRYEIPLSGRYWAIITLRTDGSFGRDERPPSLWDADPPIPPQLRARAIASPGVSVFGDAEGPNGETLRVGVRVIRLETGDRRILLMSAADRHATDQGAQRFLILLVGAMIALAAGVLVALVVQIRLALRPLARVQADVAAVREGQRTRLDDDYPSEVLPLAEEVNKLLDHNQEIVERARTHVGNLAHALKTPLAVLRNEAVGTTALDDVVRRQTAAMHSNVEHYLERAHAAARAQTLSARTPIMPVLDGLVRLLNRLFAEKGITLSADLPPGEVFRGEKQDLEEMLGNLMENACKWAASRVEVSAEMTGRAGIELHIDDDGPGLGEAEREQALKRGVRLDESAPGTGLGLSIVKELAELHSGELTLGESPLGGLRASLRLPRR